MEVKNAKIDKLNNIIYKFIINFLYNKKFIGGDKMLLTILIFISILLTTSYIIADL